MSRDRFATGFSVGFVLFAATILAIVGLFWVGGGKSFFEAQSRYYVLCPSTTGLKTGSWVKLSGVPVGTVERIDFHEDPRVNKVRVTLSIARKHAGRIRSDSRVVLAPEGLLGDVSAHISLGSPGAEPLPEGEEIEFRELTLLDTVIGEGMSGGATDLIAELIGLLRMIRQGEGTIGKLLKEPEFYDNLSAFTAELDKLTRTLNEIAKDMGDIIEEVESQRGALGKLIFAKDYEEKISSALDESAKLIGALERIVAATEGRSSVAMRLLTDEELGARVASLVDSLEKSAKSLEVVLAKVERGEGSLGEFVHDPSFARSLRDVFLGVQELEYLRNLIRNAELQGRQLASQEDRASLSARAEAARARFLASLPHPGAGGELGRPVPAAGTPEDKPPEPEKAEERKE
jgi:phospholipid/cholesterol/gamma-HCH transport system substrate-binding protein